MRFRGEGDKWPGTWRSCCGERGLFSLEHIQIGTTVSIEKAGKFQGLHVFPAGSDGEEFACNAGDLGLIPGSERSPEEGHGSPLHILAWRTPGTEESGGLQSIGLQRVRFD